MNSKFVKNIIIDINSTIKDKCLEFVLDIQKEFIKYRDELIKQNKYWERINGNDNVFLQPEKLSIKSPLTILNAPWGTGKTYFVEHIAYYWDDISKNEEIKFKNIIIIDTWKYINFENVSNQIVIEIYFLLLKIIEKNNLKKDNVKKITRIFVKFLPIAILIISIIVSLNNPDDLFAKNGLMIFEAVKSVQEEMENFEQNKKEKTFEEKIEEINSKIKPTIIIFDNIERMDFQSWEIIKTIQKLSIFSNFIFLLPMNKEKLKFNLYDESINENAIDKYISLNSYYDLKQDYMGLLQKMDFSTEYQFLINEVLKTSISGNNLSVRIVEKSFKHHDILNAFNENKYQGLVKLQEIWNPEELIKDIISDDIDNLIDFVYEIDKNIFFKFNNLDWRPIFPIFNELMDEELINLKYKNIFNQFNKEIRTFSFIDDFLFNWNKLWEECLEELENLKEQTSCFLTEKKQEAEEIKNKINFCEKENKKIEKTITKLKNKIDEYNNDKETIATEEKIKKYSKNMFELDNQKKAKERNDESNTKAKQELQIIDSQNNKLIKIKEDIQNSLIDELKKIKEDFKEKINEYKKDKDNSYIWDISRNFVLYKYKHESIYLSINKLEFKNQVVLKILKNES